MKYKVLSIDLDWLQSHFHLKNLNALFFDKVKTAERIVFSKHHHAIINELSNKDNILLHNIDQHHDICYQDWQKSEMQTGRATHGCWVGNLIYERKLNEYHWYKNGDSQLLRTHHPPQIFFTDLMIDTNLSYHMREDLTLAESTDIYDLIFVCSSSENSMIKKQYSSVYDVYKHMCETYHRSKTFEIQLIPDLPNTPLWIK